MGITARAPRRPQGVARERSLLDALASLLAERSLSEIDIRAITTRAGVTRSGFYFYFPTKEAAVAALLAEVGDELLDAGAAWYGDDAGPGQKRVARGMAATIACWRKHPDLIVAIADATATDRTAAAAWQTWQERFVDRAAARIARDPAVTVAGTTRQMRAIAHALVDMTTASMVRDLRHLLATGSPLSDIESAIVHVWSHALYR